MPGTKTRTKTKAKRIQTARRRRRRDIGVRGIRVIPISATPASTRPSHYMVPTLIRWPKGLLEAVDAELERRKKKTPSWKRDWWLGPHSRASTIRELVSERLHVSARDGSPVKGGAK